MEEAVVVVRDAGWESIEEGEVVSAHDVARELRGRLPGIGVVKLHKLLYYVQGWHLATTGDPLFREPIQAWANGPVVADVWADEKHGRGRPPERPLHGSAAMVLDYVVERYGGLSGRDLIQLTHREGPWLDVSESEDAAAVPSPTISGDALRRWFEQDEAWRARVEEVEALRSRRDVYGFGPLTQPDVVADAVDRARRGERVRHDRPA
jgi:uncharacterized phage-associated protein